MIGMMTKRQQTTTIDSGTEARAGTEEHRGIELSMTPVGLEPTIPGSVGRCLIHWATGPCVIRDDVAASTDTQQTQVTRAGPCPQDIGVEAAGNDRHDDQTAADNYG